MQRVSEPIKNCVLLRNFKERRQIYDGNNQHMFTFCTLIAIEVIALKKDTNAFRMREYDVIEIEIGRFCLQESCNTI